MKRLIVTADDVGLHRGMTEGAIRAHREGIVTACSIVANGRAFDDAVARLRDVPSLEAGVHMTLVEEESLTGIRLPESWRSFRPWTEVGGELRAQIEKVLATGLPVTHLNTHQHLHAWPHVNAIVQQLSREYGIGYVRRVDDRGGHGGPMRRVAISMLNRIGRKAAGTNDRTIGVMQAGRLTDIKPLLAYVDGVTELVTHPGVGVDGYAHWHYDWEAETRALCDPDLREELRRRSIELIAPSALL